MLARDTVKSTNQSLQFTSDCRLHNKKNKAAATGSFILNVYPWKASHIIANVDKMLLVFLLSVFLHSSAALIHKDVDSGTSSNAVGGAEEIVSIMPKFAWIDSSSIRVVLPNGNEDVIQLWPADKIGNMLVPCLFEGKMKGDDMSYVAVSGCHHDDVVHIEIHANLFHGYTTFNIKNGITEETGRGNLGVINDLKENQKRKTRRKRDSRPDVPDVPPFLLYDVKLGYEESLLSLLGSHEAAKEYIMKVFTGAQDIMRHLSLGTRIRLRAQEPIQFVANKYWRPNIADLKDATKPKIEQNETIPIMFFTGKDITDSISYIRKGCDRKKGVGIQAHQDDIQIAIANYLHEVGHWFGLKDDEDEDEHRGNQCAGTGLMSFSPKNTPKVWSSCSKKRFPRWFRHFGSCLKIDTECETGWFGFPNCKPCNCSISGSRNQTCNQITRKCNCKDFYYGRSCAYTFHQHAGKNLRLEGLNSFISPGSNSNPPGSWPWGVSIGWLGLDGLWHHHCSGVIASNTSIITTANCLETLGQDVGKILSEMKITAGDSFLKGVRDDDNIQRRNFLKFKKHPGYEWDYHYLDIAVITLKTPLVFTKYVRPIYIPSPMESKDKEDMENLLLSISGWGKGGDGKEGDTLKNAVVTVFPDEYCISNYNGHRLVDKLFKDDIFCGGNPVDLRGVCDGDDGSPAVMLSHSPKRYTLVGLLSMSNKYNEGYFDDDNNVIPFCGSTETPNIFVRIASESIISFLYKEVHGDLDPYLPEVKTPLQCGRNAIVDGTFSSSSNVGKWPWMVSVGRPNPDNLQEWLHECGGSIVSENKVITAAHCVKTYDNFGIRAGDSDLKNAADDAQVQSRLIMTSDKHKNYDARYRYFDIAVLTLATPLYFNTTAVQPVCLNTLEDLSEKDEETYSHLVTSGWGNGDQMGDTAVMVFSELICNKTHENRRDNHNLVPNLFTNEVMCAGDPAGESGTCQGDSGGPAVYFDAIKKRYYLRAVISGSAQRVCGSFMFPNIYVRVESKPVFEFIQEMINK